MCTKSKPTMRQMANQETPAQEVHLDVHMQEQYQFITELHAEARAQLTSHKCQHAVITTCPMFPLMWHALCSCHGQPHEEVASSFGQK